MDKSSMSLGKIITFAGAYIALLIGSGFATGQEIIQYFSSYGYAGVLGTIVTFILLAYAGISFISAGYRERFENGNEIYTYYCGKYIGKFYDYFSVFFLFLSFTVMVAGFGATGNQHYDLPVWVGGIILACLAMGTVVFGLLRIVEVIGKIGPVIVIIAVVLGTVSIILNWSGFAEGAQVLAALHENPPDGFKQASFHWFMAAGSYVGFCMLWLAAFLAQMGGTAHSEQEAKLGALGGAFGFSVAVLLMTLGIYAAIGRLAGSPIPSLILAGDIHPMLATVFSLIIFAGIYTTAVPLLWTVVARFAKEGSSKFRILTIALGVIGTFIGLNMPFADLVNIIYVLNGYVGMILLVIMIVRSIQWKRI